MADLTTSTSSCNHTLLSVSFRSDLLTWYHEKRRKLPWRGDVYVVEKEVDGGDGSKKEEREKKGREKKEREKKNESGIKITSFFNKPIGNKPTVNKENDTLESKTDISAISTISIDIAESPSTASTNQLILPNPYYTWISEIMLQQTKVNTVINYYIKWINKLPTLKHLADASLEEVNLLWSGLGYYRRARFLHEGAKQIMKDYNGVIPNTIEGLKSISGIGDYTAGAIGSIAFNLQVPLVDGNVIRVLCGLLSIAGHAKNKNTVKYIWKLCENLVIGDEPGNFNQSLMELGATICIPDKPNCNICPVSKHCLSNRKVTLNNKNNKMTKLNPIVIDIEDVETPSLHKRSHENNNNIAYDLDHNNCDICDFDALRQYTTELYGTKDKLTAYENVCRFPLKVPKKKSPIYTFAVAFITRKSKSGKDVLLIQRPSTGLLAAQWELPSCRIKNDSEKSEVANSLKSDIIDPYISDIISKNSIAGDLVGPSKHIFSHQQHISFVQSFEMKINDSIEIMKEMPIKLSKYSNYVDNEDDDSESDDEPVQKKPKAFSSHSDIITVARWIPIHNLSKVVSTTNTQKLITLFKNKK